MINPLDLPQKIKVLKESNLKVPIIRTAMEPYDPDKPEVFDNTITKEVIGVNQTLNALLGIIDALTKQIIANQKVKYTPDEWKVLKMCRELIRDSKTTIRRL